MKPLVILFGLAAVILAVVGYQLFIPGTANEDREEVVELQVNETTSADPENKDFTGVGTFSSLLARGENLECSFSYKPSEYEEETTGTYFFADGRVRGDFIVPSAEMGGEVLSSIIMNEEMLYLWSEINGQSFGTKVSLEGSTEETAMEEVNVPVGNDVALQYNCRTWNNIDNSVFEPPSSVLFQDVSDLLQTGMEYGTVYEEDATPY